MNLQMETCVAKWNKLPIEVKSSVAYAICSILQRSMSFITLPLFTRLLTTEEYGQASIYSSWLSLLAVFISLYLPYGTFSTAMTKYEGKRDEYVASVDAICLLLGIIFILIYYPFHDSFNKYFDLPTYIMLVMVGEIVANTALQCWYARQRYEYRYKSVIAVTLLLAIMSPIMAVILVFNSEEKGYARILGGSLVTITVGIFFWFYNLKKGRHLYNREFWRYALMFNLPLIPYYLSQMIFNQSDRIMIGKLVGIDKAGIYNVACNLGMALTFVLTAINNSYVPWLYRKMKVGKWNDNRRVSLFIAILMAIMFFIIILLTPEIVLWLAGYNYYDAVWVVPPVTMSMLALLYGQFFVNVQFYYEKKSNLVMGMITSGIINVTLNYLLIPVCGFIVAAYTSLLCYMLNAYMYYFFYVQIKKEKKIEDSLVNIKALIALALLFSIASFSVMWLYEFFFIRYALLGVLIFAIYINRGRVLALIKELRAKDEGSEKSFEKNIE